MKKLLVVDDSETFRTMLECFFSGMGYTVTTADGGKAGLEAMKTFNPDVIILDVMMPDMTGLEVLQKMQLDASLRNIPVVVATGSIIGPDMRSQFMKMKNCRDFIEKNADLSRILEQVEAATE